METRTRGRGDSHTLVESFLETEVESRTNTEGTWCVEHEGIAAWARGRVWVELGVCANWSRKAGTRVLTYPYHKTTAGTTYLGFVGWVLSILVSRAYEYTDESCSFITRTTPHTMEDTMNWRMFETRPSVLLPGLN